ncbi:gamma-butyrobetaine dioxygenase-like isoform X1 [Panulirus ornatus]|uniref:gamma-butyrobetaine dioxygenase-like isoform X1 n=1 Tax=Panulirus ornatus TaxID=150431 RepID=UPI003A8947A5
MQATRHLMTRAGHCLRVRARLALTSHLTTTSLPAAQNMCIREVSMGQAVASQHLIRDSGNQDCLGKASVTMHSAAANSTSTMLQVCWAEGGMDLFPYVWLRDNCQCPSCFHPTTLSRKISMEDLNLDIIPTSIQMANGGEMVEIQWLDGHFSTYSANWLHERAFNKASQDRRDCFRRPPQSFWGSELLESLPRASFPELLEDNVALFTFLQQLEVTGLVVVSDTPCCSGQIHQLSKRVGYLMPTHYGETFTVQNKINANNLAYTSSSLDMHSDQPFLTHVPDIQLLHCITQYHGEGGENVLADSYHAGHILVSQHPDKFHILTTTLVDFYDVGLEDGKEYFALDRKPVISVNHEGNIQQVNFNTMVRDSFFMTSADKVAGWYDALSTFYRILKDPQNHIEYKMNEGDIIVFDNTRVLHGRKGYEMAHGDRHLEGGYWEWDQVRSRRRSLQITAH